MRTEDLRLQRIQQGQDAMRKDFNSTTEAVIEVKSAFDIGLGKLSDLGYAWLINFLTNLPLHLAFGLIFFAAFFFYTWFTRR